MSNGPDPRKLTKLQDLPEPYEQFADFFEGSIFDGTSLRLTFSVVRWNEPKPPKAPTGKRYATCRLVLTPDAAMTMYNGLSQIIAALEQRGDVRRETPPTTTIQ